MNQSLGDFEQLVLLAVLQLGSEARAADLRSRIADAAERSVSRGALYATLDRLSAKGMIGWEVEDSAPERGGIPRRRFHVTEAGLEAIRRTQRALTRLSEGLGPLLEGARR
jgi:PadR family transcriptional regulator, regulatory protein PadR